MNKKIGLVLNHPIAYSETFFLNDIKVYEQLGYKVFVFTSYTSEKITSYNHVNGYPVQIKGIKSIIRFFGGVFSLCFTSLKPAFKLYNLEKKSGIPILRILKTLYQSVNILNNKVDYLHFGFAHVAINKEFVAKSINAKMTVSLRGYDIAIFPLSHPGCYTKLWQVTDKVHTTSVDLYNIALKMGMPAKLDYDLIPLIFDSTIPSVKRNNKKLRILSVGRLHWKKGFEYSLLIIKNLIDRGVKLEYIIIGDGPQKEELLFTIHQLNLTGVVQLKGAFFYEEVIQEMTKSDIYIQTSLQEGFCSAVMEAQAAGLLVISTDAEGINENIEDGRSGWIVEKRNVKAFVQKLLEVIDLPEAEKEKITTYAKKRVAEKFNPQIQGQKWKAFFENS